MSWRVVSTMIAVGSACFLAAVIYLMKKRWHRQLTIEGRRDRLPSSKPILEIPDFKITILEDESSCEQYFARVIQKPHFFLGLDCEWVSGRGEECSTSPVALLQLAFPNMQCALVRLCKIGKITPSLARLLQDRSVLKFGVGITNDVNRLSDGFHIITEGVIDLRNLALRCGIRRNSSLAGLTNQIVGRDLVKVREITCSNWEQHQLSIQQIHYAASDAIAALLILKNFVRRKLNHKRGHFDVEEAFTSDFLMKPCTNNERTGRITEDGAAQHPYQDDNQFDLLLTDEAIKCAHSLCQGLVGTEYKRLSKENAPLTNDRILPVRHSSAYSVRKTPLYHNCQLKAPDGTLLSTVDQKKIDWYLSKGLGVLISKDPPIVQLNFKPSGKPSKDREYYLAEKENICVVCGRRDTYIRKNIIPHEYRKHFPKEKKEHMSHDVLLLCVSCHQLSDSYDRFMRCDLSLEYGVPLDAGTQKYREDPERVRRRSLARAISGQRRLPEKRKSEILDGFAEYFKCKPSEITPEMLEEVANLETRTVNEDFVSHGELLVKAVMERGELVDFQRKWRVHFIDSMKPKFLPKLWSVDHNPQS